MKWISEHRKSASSCLRRARFPSPWLSLCLTGWWLQFVHHGCVSPLMVSSVHLKKRCQLMRNVPRVPIKRIQPIVCRNLPYLSGSLASSCSYRLHVKTSCASWTLAYAAIVQIEIKSTVPVKFIKLWSSPLLERYETIKEVLKMWKFSLANSQQAATV